MCLDTTSEFLSVVIKLPLHGIESVAYGDVGVFVFLLVVLFVTDNQLLVGDV